MASEPAPPRTAPPPRLFLADPSLSDIRPATVVTFCAVVWFLGAYTFATMAALALGAWMHGADAGRATAWAFRATWLPLVLWGGVGVALWIRSRIGYVLVFVALLAGTAAGATNPGLRPGAVAEGGVDVISPATIPVFTLVLLAYLIVLLLAPSTLRFVWRRS